MKLVKYKNRYYDERGVVEYDAYLFGFIYLYSWAYGEKFRRKNRVLNNIKENK